MHPKIGFILPSMSCGGVESFILRTGAYLKQKGCLVEVVTTQSPGLQFGEIEENNLVGNSLNVSKFTIPLLHARRIASLIRSRGYDVVFNNQCPLTQMVAGQVHDHCTVITMIHGNVDWLFNQYLTNERAINLYVGISPAIINRAKTVLKERPIVHIPHGFEIPRENGRMDPSFPTRDCVNLLFAGRIEDEDKGVYYLPEILKCLRESGISAKLRIAGTGSCEKRLIEKLETEKVRAQVEFLGYLSKEQIYAEYQRAHILLFPSRHEGFGLSLIEAMAFGCVPVASLIPGVTDSIIDHGSDGLLVPIGDVVAFGDCVLKLCDNAESWKSMSKVGRAKVRDQYSFASTCDTYWKIVSKAMNREYALSKPRNLTEKYDRGLLRPRYFIPEGLFQFILKIHLNRKVASVRSVCI